MNNFSHFHPDAFAIFTKDVVDEINAVMEKHFYVIKEMQKDPDFNKRINEVLNSTETSLELLLEARKRKQIYFNLAEQKGKCPETLKAEEEMLEAYYALMIDERGLEKLEHISENPFKLEKYENQFKSHKEEKEPENEIQ